MERTIFLRASLGTTSLQLKLTAIIYTHLRIRFNVTPEPKKRRKVKHIWDAQHPLIYPIEKNNRKKSKPGIK